MPRYDFIIHIKVEIPRVPFFWIQQSDLPLASLLPVNILIAYLTWLSICSSLWGAYVTLCVFGEKGDGASKQKHEEINCQCINLNKIKYNVSTVSIKTMK